MLAHGAHDMVRMMFPWALHEGKVCLRSYEHLVFGHDHLCSHQGLIQQVSYRLYNKSGTAAPSIHWINSLTLPLGRKDGPLPPSTIVITSLTITCDPGAEAGFSGATAMVSPAVRLEVLENNSTASSVSASPSLSAVVVALSSLGLSGVVEIGEGIASASIAAGWPKNLTQVSNGVVIMVWGL